jgi:hypothetical protein
MLFNIVLGPFHCSIDFVMLFDSQKSNVTAMCVLCTPSSADILDLFGKDMYRT